MYIRKDKKYIMLHCIKKEGSIEYGLYKTDKDTLGWELVCGYKSMMINDKDEMIDIRMLKSIVYMANKGYELIKQT